MEINIFFIIFSMFDMPGKCYGSVLTTKGLREHKTNSKYYSVHKSTYESTQAWIPESKIRFERAIMQCAVLRLLSRFSPAVLAT